MTPFVKIGVNDIVFDKELKVHGKVKFIDNREKTAKIEVIISFNEDTSERTTRLIESKLFNLVVINKEKSQPSYDPNKWWSDVRRFQIAFGHPAPSKPTMLTKERIKLRNSWMYEECREMEDAETLLEQVDAALDKLYFALGDLVELGVVPDKLFDIVQQANMGKLFSDGKPRYNQEGKIIKPENWQRDHAPEPKLEKEIKRQLERKQKGE